MFKELNTQLGSDFLVLHSVHWVASKGGRNQDGEADFIIAHPDLGVLVMEVKGGTIRRDGPTDTWFTRSWDGTESELKMSPFLQAERSMYSLREKLATTPATAGFTYPLSRTVAFPDVLLDDESLGVDVQRSMIVDSSNVFLMAKAITSAMGQAAGPGPGPAGVNALLELIRPSFAISRLGLAARLKQDEAEIVHLTAQQLRLLDVLAGHRKIAVNGIAGSGKTLMAKEHARRLANAGLIVLFTCYNKALAAEVRSDLANAGTLAGGSVTVHTYHDLGATLVQRAGITVDGDLSIDAAAYYEHALPQAMADAISVLDTRFDAIVVDEGQDFADVWWLTLDLLMRDPGDGFFAIFYDNNQRIFRNDSTYPLPEPHFKLTHNCRCTRTIHQKAAGFVGLDASTVCDGPEGRGVELVPIESGSPLATLRKVVHRLTQDEGIPLSEIVVLTPRSVSASELTNHAAIGNLTLEWESDGPKSVRCRNIHAFKGLESSIVILAELDRAHRETRNRLIHVALTPGQTSRDRDWRTTRGHLRKAARQAVLAEPTGFRRCLVLIWRDISHLMGEGDYLLLSIRQVRLGELNLDTFFVAQKEHRRSGGTGLNVIEDPAHSDQIQLELQAVDHLLPTSQAAIGLVIDDFDHSVGSSVHPVDNAGNRDVPKHERKCCLDQERLG